MDEEDDRREQIVKLEARIETLAESIERCRKIDLISRLGIGAGAALLLAITLGAIRFDPVGFVASIALVIGGIVVLGSNRSTSQQATAQLRAAEIERAELIGQLDLPVAGASRLG